MLKVLSLKRFASENKGFAFWVELVAPGLCSAGYLSYVVCELLHRSGVLPCAQTHIREDPTKFVHPLLNEDCYVKTYSRKINPILEESNGQL